MLRSGIIYILPIIFLLAVASGLSGCGQIKGMSLPYIPSPKAVVQTPTSPAEGDVAIILSLIDRELEDADVTIEYSTDNGQSFATATLTTPAEALNLATAWCPGQTHTVTWDSVADAIALSGNETVLLKITPSDASNPSGTEGYTGAFTVNNTAYNEVPTATLSTPAGTMSGNIPINYFISDAESNPCSISVLYSTNGGTSYQAATMGSAGDGLTGLSSSLSGTAHMYLWDSIADGVGLSTLASTIRIRITPNDSFHSGTSGDTNSFSVDNSVLNSPPTVTITSGPADSSTVSTTQVTYEWTGNDTDGTVTGYYYSFDQDPPNVWTTDTSVASGVLSEGSHTFRIVAVDDQYELSDVESRTFTVELAGTITAAFSASPTSGAAPLTVNFTDLSTSTNGITSWSWSFGDMAVSSTQSPSHEYAGEGVFTVSLTVTGPDGEDTETKTGYINVGGGTPDDMVRDWQGCDFGPDDGNVKLIVDGNCIKLAPEGDVFGSIISDWSEIGGDEILGAWPSKGSCSYSEASGKLTWADAGNSPYWMGARRNNVSYLDFDVVFYWSDTEAQTGNGIADVWMVMFKEFNEYISMIYRTKWTTGNQYIAAFSVTGGSSTQRGSTISLGNQSDIWFRMKRVAATNTYTFYYATSNPMTTPANWVQVWSGTINDFTVADEFQSVAGVYVSDSTSSWTFTPDLDYYTQISGNEERFWPDSPECDIIDSSAGTPEYCLDAGTGGTWMLTGCSPMVFLTGTSTIKFKAGWSDSPTRASATWINSGNWLTPAELDAQTAAGALDGHRYVFLKAQFNSDGPDQPALGPVTFSDSSSNEYMASEFDISPALDDNNQKVIVDGSSAKLAPDGDEFGSIIDTRWLKTVGDYIENGGVMVAQSGTGGTDFIERQIEYEDADIAVHWSNTYPLGGDLSYGCVLGLILGIDTDNFVRIRYFARKIGTPKFNIDTHKAVNGAWTIVDWTDNIGEQTSITFRIRRRKSDNHFWTYYNTGAGWIETWNGAIDSPGNFDSSSLVKPWIYAFRDTNSVDWKPEADNYYQVTDAIPAQRFWPDSPEILVVDHTGVDYAFDAGASHVWDFWNAECVKSEPGTSSVLFKVGWSNTGNDADVTWVDSTWRTIAQVDTNAAAGNYNGHRYIHVKAQFNSDGTDQSTLSSFTIQGTKSVP